MPTHRANFANSCNLGRQSFVETFCSLPFFLEFLKIRVLGTEIRDNVSISNKF